MDLAETSIATCRQEPSGCVLFFRFQRGLIVITPKNSQTAGEQMTRNRRLALLEAGEHSWWPMQGQRDWRPDQAVVQRPLRRETCSLGTYGGLRKCMSLSKNRF